MRTQSAKPNKTLAFVVGTGMALFGLWLVIDSIPRFEQFAMRHRITYGYRPGNGQPLADGRYAHTVSGFEVGATALFGAVLFSVGTGVAASQFFNAEGRRMSSLVLAVLWHALGIATAVWFLQLAPRPLSFGPLLVIGVFEWLGLIPLALGVSKDWLNGRLNSAVWFAWLGAIPGGVLGGLVGAVTDFVRFVILKHSMMNGFAILAWDAGILVGAATVGIGFFAYGCLFDVDRKTNPV